MNSVGPKQATSVVMAKKGQALPSSNGPRAGAQALAFSSDERERDLPRTQETSSAPRPAAVLTGEVVARGRTPSDERSDSVERNHETDVPDEKIRPEENNDTTFGSGDEEDTLAAPRKSHFLTNAALIIMVICMTILMTWVALYA